MGKVVNQNDLNAVIDSASKILDPIKSVVDSIGAIIKNAPKVSDKQIQSATETIQKMFGYINVIAAEMVKVTSKLDESMINDVSKKVSAAMGTVQKSMGTMLEIMNTKIGIGDMIKMRFKIRRVARLLKRTVKELVYSLASINVDPTVMQKAKPLMQLMASVNGIMDALQKMKTGGVGRRQIRRLTKVFRCINDLVMVIASLNAATVARALKTANSIKMCMVSIGLVLAAILLMLPIMLLFIVASPIIMLGFWLTMKIINVLVRMVSKAITAKTVIGLMLLVGVMGVVLLVGLMLLALVEIAQKASGSFMDLIEFLGTLMVVVGLMAGLGALLGSCMAVVGVIIVGMAVMTLIMTLLLVMAFELKILEELELDKGKILTNVHIVIDTAFEIIKAVFDAAVEQGGSSKEEPWYKQILGFLGGAAMQMMSAILAVALLAITVVSVGLILLIALELRLLQELDLDPGKIVENVGIVIDTAKLVVNSIFGVPDVSSSPSDKSIFQSIMEWVGGALLTVISAIFAVAFLTTMIIAICAILLIAAQLRLIQELDLDQKKIQENVRIVIETAQMVVSTIFAPDTKKANASDKGIFMSIIELIGGPIVDVLMAVFALAYLSTMIVSIFFILLIAWQLKALQEIDLDPVLIQENVRIVIETAQMVVSTIFDPGDRDNTPSEKSFIRTVLEFLGLDGIVTIIEAIMALAFLGLIFFSIYLIKCIAEQLKYIQDIQLDAAKIQQNIRDIVGACHAVINAVFAPDNTKGKSADGIFRKILKWCFPKLMSIIDALMTVGFLAISMTAVGMLGEIAGHLTTLAKLPSMRGIDKKVREVVGAARTVISAVVGSGGGLRQLARDHNAAKQAERLLNMLNSSVKKLGTMMEGLYKVADADQAKLELAKENTVLVVGLVDSIVLEAKAKKEDIDVKLAQAGRLQYLVRYFASVTPNQISNSQRFLDNYGKFLDKVGGVDLEKLKTTENMFKNMANFSNSISGDFDKLADSLNEKIAPMLEKLQTLMEEVGKKVESASASISASVRAASDSNPSSGDVEEQVKREKPGADAKAIATETAKRVKKQATKKSGTEKKLDELISMFKNKQARVSLS